MDSKAMETKVHRLEFQKQKLSEKLEVQKKELAAQQQTIDSQFKRWTEAQSAVLAIRRGWAQFLEDLETMASSSGLDLRDSDLAFEEGCSFFDPMIQVLLAPAQRKEEQTMIDEVRAHAQTSESLAESVDIEIKRESERVTRFLAKILDHVQKGSSPKHVSDAKWKAAYRAASSRAKMAEDKLACKETELTDVRNELADRLIELESAQRKILSLKNAAPFVPPKPANEPPPPEPVVEEKEKKEIVMKDMEQVMIDSLIQSKVEELEIERNERRKLEKELRSKELSFKSEEWIFKTKVYKAVVEEKNRLVSQLEAKTKELEEAQHQLMLKDREIAKKRVNDPESRIQNFETSKEKGRRLEELHNQILKTEKLYSSEGSPKATVSASTIDEYNDLLKEQQKTTALLRKRLKEKGDASKIESARNKVIEAEKRVQISESRIAHLRETVRELEDTKKQLLIREEQLMQDKDDLKVFVDVLSTLDVVNKQWKESEAKARDINMVRENSSLKRKIEHLERVCGDEEAHKELESCRDRIEKMSHEIDQLNKDLTEAMVRTKHLEEDIQQQKQITTGLEEELETTGLAFEDAQTKGARYLKQLDEKEATAFELKHQITKLTHRIGTLTALTENWESEVKALQRDPEELEAIKSEFRGKVDDLSNELSTLRTDNSTLLNQLHEAHGETLHARTELQNLNLKIESLQRASTEFQKMAETHIEERDNERSKRQKLEMEVKAFEDLKRKFRAGMVTQADLSDDQDITTLNQEIESLRRSLTCSICGARRKSVILTKCMHTFCKPCIDKCIETRSRRCPGCGSPFSREEVRHFYLS